jgi:hypothetical protein
VADPRPRTPLTHKKFVLIVTNGNAQFKIDMKKINILISVILIAGVAYVLGLSAGKAKFNAQQQVNLENGKITECDGSGCYVLIPDYDTVYLPCGNNYSCTRLAKTSEQKEQDAQREKELDEIFKNLPAPTQ